jgi:DNA mismatch repair protein MutL
LGAVYGVELARELVALPDSARAEVQVEGFVSPPSVNRSNRKHLTFFVNGRWVQDSSLTAAVIQAYHGLLMVGRYPLAVLFIELPNAQVDVNVHPTKSEIRFRDQQLVFTVVQRSVRAVLLGQSPPPVELDSRWGSAPRHFSQAMISPDWQAAHGILDEGQASDDLEAQPRLARGDVPLLRPVGQVGAAYLVAEGPDGIYLIDQHAAHERILFEALMAAHERREIESQSLLEPEVMEFTPSEAAIIAEHLEVMRELGFGVEPFGGKSYMLRSMPALLTNLTPGRALRTVVEDFEEDEAPLEADTEARIAARVCKRSAVKAGQVLSTSEQRQLLRDLEACSTPRTCPHGRPTMIHLSVQSLEKQFGRRG